MIDFLLGILSVYVLGVVLIAIAIVASHSWDVHGWSRAKKFWTAAYAIPVNALLWPYLVVKLVWEEL